jgi:hypothetical protein
LLTAPPADHFTAHYMMTSRENKSREE